MPVHDWKRVEAGIFHAFHQLWISELCNHLNRNRLPSGFFALPEQRVSGPELDVLALKSNGHRRAKKERAGGTAVIETPPRTRFVEETESELYAKSANRIAVHYGMGRVVAFIEIVSPGNKSSRHALRAFVEKATQFLNNGVHLLVVDLFPPGKRDPEGIHRVIWEEMTDTSFKLPAKKPLTLAAYSAGLVTKAYVEPVAVGDAMPDMPLFLETDKHIPTPLQASYQATWDGLPDEMKELFD